jgi:hypothetical protein
MGKAFLPSNAQQQRIAKIDWKAAGNSDSVTACFVQERMGLC